MMCMKPPCIVCNTCVLNPLVSHPEDKHEKNTLQLTGQVGQAILQRGGQSIQTELQQQLFTQNNYSVTGAGQLACKHVFHIVTGNDGTQMENVLMEVFEQADSLRIHSLSIPAIGTGNSSLTSSAAARHINRAIHIFEGNVRTSPTLHQINIVVFQHQMMADFQQEFGVSASQANVASKSNQLGLPKFSSAVQDTDNVTLYICSNQQNNVDKALKSINQHIQNITSVKYIDDEIIKQLTSIEVKEIGQLARKHQVKIETTETAFVTRMIIRGIKESVLETYSRVVEIISQLKQAVSCAELVQWKYRGNAQEGEFPLRVNLMLEETYKKKANGKVLVRINSNSQQRNYNIDFSTMKEHCVQTNQTFDIIRTAVGETAFPNTWEDLQGNPWKVFQVQAGSNEYNQVIQKFQQGAAYIQTIVKLERIQNVALYKQFLAQEEKVRAKMSSRGVGQTVTRELFHGTSGDVTDNIYRNGFDRSHAGKNGGSCILCGYYNIPDIM